MTLKQIQLVQNSWQQISLLDASVVGQIFYTRLLDANPELKQLFRSPVPEQSKKLILMISFIIARLHKPEEMLNEVQKLAQRHVRYGVEEKHYELVGAALLWTLKKALSDCWHPELEEAWVTCYSLLTCAMLDASQEAAMT